MRSVSFNNQRVNDITSSEYDALCLLLPYWGLQISEDGEEIKGALSTFMLGIHGLPQQKLKELSQLLQHTGISITTNDNDKCNQRFYVDFHANHPMPLALKTPDRQLYYLNPATSIHFPVQSAIHKGITLKRKDGPLFLAVQPVYEKQITEWISYLVIQSFLRVSFESLTSISESTFKSCVEKVLCQVNDSFASKQLPNSTAAAVQKQSIPQPIPKETAPEKSETIKQEKELPKNNPSDEEYTVVSSNYSSPATQKVSVPPVRPFSAAGSLITNSTPKPFSPGMVHNPNSAPIKPFKNSSVHKEHTIQPFHTKETFTNQKSVIRPFQSKQNTPSSHREYNNNTSNIFRKRRDGK